MVNYSSTFHDASTKQTTISPHLRSILKDCLYCSRNSGSKCFVISVG